jgi:hypothetical protein
VHRKIIGIFSLLLGLMLTAACVFGLSQVPGVADMGAADADPTIVSAHWHTLLFEYLGLGVMVIAGGVLTLRGNAAGTLLVATSALIAAAFPWVSSALGYARFGFEQGNAVESCLWASMGAFMVLMYRQRERWLT